MMEQQKEQKQTRDNLTISLYPREKKIIARACEKTGEKISAFLRTSGLLRARELNADSSVR